MDTMEDVATARKGLLSWNLFNYHVLLLLALLRMTYIFTRTPIAPKFGHYSVATVAERS